MITSGTYFVFPSESNLDIDSTDGLVKIVLPTAEAISTFISGNGSQVPEVIGYTIVGAATNPVRFYRGGGLLWNSGAEYLEITADGSGTISRSNGIESISEAVLNSGGGTGVAVSVLFMQLDAAQVLNEYTITESGDYIMQLELYGQHDNSGAGIGYFYTEVTKNGSPIANDNNTHQNSVARNTKCTYTHTAKISAVIGDAIGFNVYKTMVTQDNGSITLIKTA